MLFYIKLSSTWILFSAQLEFFGNKPAVYNGESGILFVYHPDGTATGDAFAIFGHEEDGRSALKKHREKIGTRYVELFRSTQAELQQVRTLLSFYDMLLS